MTEPRFTLTVDGTPLDEVSLLARMEVRESDREATVAALRFNLAQRPSGQWSPLDDALFSPASRLRIELEGHGAPPTVIFHGYVTHLRPHFEPIESNGYLEVLAMDAAALLGAEERAHAYPDATDSEAVTEVFERHGVPVTVAPTAARHAADRGLLVQRATDWEFVQALARRNGYVCYFEPDPSGDEVRAYFRPPALQGAPQADLSIHREDANLAWVDLQAKATSPARVTGAAIDPIARRIVRADGTPSLDALGDTAMDVWIEQGLRRHGATGSKEFLRDVAADAGMLEVMASAASDRARFAVEARGEVQSALYRGLLRARRPVTLKGVGSTFAGVYYVRSVRTVLHEGTLSQHFIAERNALGLTGREAFGRRAEEEPSP